MRPVKQTLFGGPDGPIEEIGNCYPACIASILEIPLEDVPHFFQLERNSEKSLDLILSWSQERSLTIICYAYEEWLHRYFPNFIGIIGGQSPRGDFDHAVVGRITKTGWEILHDPHPSNSGIVGEPKHFEIILPLNYWSL